MAISSTAVILVDAQDLAASRPGKPLYAGVSLTISTGDRLGVVGLNGCGKSTLLRQIAGRVDLESGVVRHGRGARIVMLDQDAPLPAGTVHQAVGGSWEGDAVLDRLGLGHLGARTVDELSGGQAKRVALARALAQTGEEDVDNVLLILDEPTNHLDIDAISWLEERLAAHRGGLLVVTHDRHVLDRVTTRMIELDRGSAYAYDGGYAAYLEGRATRAEREERAEDVRRNLARRELAWLRRGAKARTRKAKARITSATELITTSAPEPARAGELDLAGAGHGTPRLGNTVVELHRVSFRHPGSTDAAGADADADADGPWLLRGVELALQPNERLGVLGPNGAGKSTLLDLIAGRLVPQEGEVVTGSTVALGYHDQQGVTLDLAQRVRDAVAGPHRQPDHTDAALLERFWFGSDAQFAPIGLLSGGERRRLQLLLTLAQRPNVLLLDEPTNDLDLDTLRVLEDFLEDWPGALVVVSHDRAFLERTVTDVVVIDEQARVRRLRGGYEAWEEARRAARVPGRVGSGTPAGATKKAGAAADSTTARTTAAKPAPATATGSAGTPAARRSPSTLRHLLKEAERDVRRLERRHVELSERAHDPAVVADHASLAEVGKELAEVAEALREAEERWLEVSVEADG